MPTQSQAVRQGRRTMGAPSLIPAINAQVDYLPAIRAAEQGQENWEDEQSLNREIADRNHQLAVRQGEEAKKANRTATMASALSTLPALYEASSYGKTDPGKAAVTTASNVAETAANRTATGDTGPVSTAVNAAGGALSKAGDYGKRVFSTFSSPLNLGIGGAAAVGGAMLGDDAGEKAAYGAALGAGGNLVKQAISNISGGGLFSKGYDLAETLGTGFLGLLGGLG